jgi:methionyl aminopeptidase
MIPLKNERQIRGIREACAVAASVLQELKGLVRPGISTQDLEEAGIKAMGRHDATSACFGYQIGSRRYPAHTCISVNEEVVHGIPGLRRILKDGDIVSLDVVVRHAGYIGDNAVTVPVGAIAPKLAELLRVSEEALRLGISAAVVGNRIGDISVAVQRHVERHGFSVVRDLVGHGVGIAMHEEPQIPNFGRAGSGERIKPGMTLAIEPMVNVGSYRTKTLADGWTVVTSDGSHSAHFEHTVLTTDRGPEILTIPKTVLSPVHACDVPAPPAPSSGPAA